MAINSIVAEYSLVCLNMKKKQLFKLIKKTFFFVSWFTISIFFCMFCFSVDVKVLKVYLKITTVLALTLFDELSEPLKYTKRKS